MRLAPMRRKTMPILAILLALSPQQLEQRLADGGGTACLSNCADQPRRGGRGQ
jgi:hypothetical protein